MMSRASFTGLILAGGLARRMQDTTHAASPSAAQGGHAATTSKTEAASGLEKGLALLHGEPLVAHACRALAPQVGALLISANRHTEHYARYAQVISDDPALGSHLGPLAGVASGLASVRSPWLAVLPVDVLGVPPDMVSRLAQGAADSNAPAAYVVASGQCEPRPHPLCMVVRSSLAPSLRAYLQRGDRKVFLWMSQIGAAPVYFDEGGQAFANINTLDDLTRAGL